MGIVNWISSIVVLIYSCQLMAATEYYVSPSGNDSHDGNLSQPFRTIDRINLLDLNAGDTIFFEGGCTFSGSLYLDVNDRGTAEVGILITSYGTGRAMIDAGTEAGLVASQTDYLVIQNIDFMGKGRLDGNTTHGVVFEDCQFVSIIDAEVQGFQHAGVYSHDSNDVTIKGVHAHHNGFAGISIYNGSRNSELWNKNIYVGHCVTENNPGDPTRLNNHSGSGIVVSGCRDATIEYCTAFENGWDMPRTGNGPVGIWMWNVDRGTIQHCIAYNNTSTSNDGGGFDLDGGCRNCTIQYCLSYNNKGTGYLMSQFTGSLMWYNNTVRYCVSHNDGWGNHHAAVHFWQPDYDASDFHHCYIYNNVFYNEAGYAVDVNKPCKDIYLINNVFMCKTKDFFRNIRDARLFFNNYYHLESGFQQNGYTDLTKWAKETGKESLRGRIIGMNQNPLFLDIYSTPNVQDPLQLKAYQGFQVQPLSPLIDAGVDLQSLIGLDPGLTDFYGTEIPQGPAFDMGCHEDNQD